MPHQRCLSAQYPKCHWLFWTVPVLPLHVVQDNCDDPRHPAMFSDWITSCDSSGQVDALVRVGSQKRVELEQDKGALVSAQLWWSGIRGGRWNDDEIDQKYRLNKNLIAPAVIGDDWVVGLGESEVWIKSMQSQQIIRISARPKPWHMPAVLEQQIAWTNDDGYGGSDIWTWSENEGAKTLSTELTWEQGVVAWSNHWAWFEPERIVIQNVQTDEQREIRTQVVDGLTVWEDGICWSARGANDLDIFCSDGLILERDGDQRWPYRSNNIILFRENEQVMLWTLEKDK